MRRDIAGLRHDAERITLPEQTHEVSAEAIGPVLAKFFA